MMVRIHIERLVVEGLGIGSGDAQVVGMEVTAELTRLIRDGKMSWTAGMAVPRVRGAFSQVPGSGAKEVGTQIAGAIVAAKT